MSADGQRRQDHRAPGTAPGPRSGRHPGELATAAGAPRRNGGAALLLRGPCVLPDRVLPDAVLAVDGDRIAAVTPADEAAPEVLDAAARAPGTVLPGLVDVHCHGGGGGAFTAGDEGSARTAAAAHRALGTTTLVASLVTASPEDLRAGVALLADLADAGVVDGIHLEGPYLSAARCGAQDPRWLRPPDAAELAALLDLGRGHVRQATLAPELPGSRAAVAALLAAGAVAAGGHTDADRGAVLAAVDAGAALATHLFNGMRPWQHRDAGAVAGLLAAAARGSAAVELISDGVHLDAGTVATVFDLVGDGHVVLVTDAMAAAGMPDGRYVLGPQEVEVSGGVARLPGGTRSIAGGTSRLVDCVRFAVRAAGVPLERAVHAAATAPAAVLGFGDVGALEAGRRADLLVVDDDLRPVAVMRAGRWLDGAPPGT